MRVHVVLEDVYFLGGYNIKGDFYEFLQIIVFGQHIQNIASFFGTFDVSLPFARPLSDKLGRRISVLIGAASYVIFFIGIAFSPNIQVAYVAAVLGGIANSFLDTATYPAVAQLCTDIW